MSRKRDLLFAGLFLFGLWWIIAPLLDSMALPAPSTVMRDMLNAAVSGTLLADLAVSALRAILGMVIALAAAVPLGMIIGVEPALRRRLSPFIYLLYPIPHVVLLPLIIILFGIGNLSKIILIALIVFFQILVTTRDAAKNIDQNYFYSMQSLGASRLQIYRHVILPASLPKILTAMRISIGTAIAILFFVESFATTSGLGYRIMDSWGQADYVGLYTGICSMAMLGYGSYLFLDLLERKICRWTIAR